MTSSLHERGVRAVVLDIEGTTTPVSFVYDVLFRYASDHLDSFVHAPEHAEVMQELAAQFAREHLLEPEAVAAPLWRQDTRQHLLQSVVVYASWLMERDRKSTALKALQGHMWAIGYRSGALRGAVFPDVPSALSRWRAAGLTVSIYSSGSVQAQQLIFSMTDEGDLTPLIAHYFDTAVGTKRSMDSYQRIATALGEAPAHILFVSDVSAELDAARAAGWQVLLAVRPDHYAPNPSGYEEVHSFNEIS